MHRRNVLLAAALAVGAAGLATPAIGHPGDPGDPPHQDVVVDQASFGSVTGNGWQFTPDQDPRVGTGSVELVAGPLTPLSGSGSLRFQNTDTNHLTTVTNRSDVNGKLLSALTGASYATLVDADSAAGPVQVSLKVAVPGTTLVFEPYYAFNSLALQRGVWHAWDAASAPTGWWDTKGLTSCSMAAPCSFATIKAQVDPSGTLTMNDVKLGVGRGTSNFDGNVDYVQLQIGSQVTRWDFESNAVNNDVVTRVDEANSDGWTFDGSAGSASGGSYSVQYAGGPTDATGGASVSLNHTGAGSYSSILQNYAEGRGDLTQQYLGALDNIEADTYKLGTSTNGDYPTVRFEVRLPDPSTQFAFSTILNVPTGTTNGGAIDRVKGIHPTSSTADTPTWQLSRPIAGLEAWTPYTWAQLMRTPLRDAVIMKARVMAGTAGSGEFHGGVDVLRFTYRDGSSKTWDFQKAGFPTPPPVTPPAAPSALSAVASTTVTSIDLTWTDNSTNEAGFAIERSTNASFPAAEVVSVAVGPNVTSFTSSGLAAGTEYFFRVRAANSGGASDYTNVASATTIADPDVTAPVVGIDNADNSVNLPIDPATRAQTTTTISGTASDAVGIVAISVKVTNALGTVVRFNIICREETGPGCGGTATNRVWSTRISFPNPSTTYPPTGRYTVTAYAVDAAGNLGTSPSVSIITFR